MEVNFLKLLNQCLKMFKGVTEKIDLVTSYGFGFWKVVLPSGKAVAEIEPNIHEIKKCPGRGIIVTGLASAGSGFDFFSRFFCPKLEVDEVISLTHFKI